MKTLSISDIKKEFYEALYKRFPAYKIYGDIKSDWCWQVIEKVLSDKRICKTV